MRAPNFSTAAALAASIAFGAVALAADDHGGAPRGVALDNAIKNVCASQFRVNAQEIDYMNLLMRGAFGKLDAAAFDAAKGAEDAKIEAEIDAAGATQWCSRQRAKLLDLGGARMFE